MIKDLVKKLHETFGDLKSLTPAKIDEFIQETLAVFERLNHGFQSADPEEQEEAIGLANTLKAALQEQSDKLCEMTGVNRDTYQRELQNPDNFNKEDWDLLTNLSTNLKEMSLKTGGEKGKKKKHKSQTIRLVG